MGYSVKDGAETATLKGAAYEFVSRSAYCEQCGNAVYVAELEDRNLKSLYAEYRQRNDIISLDDVRAIPEKYNIGKKPLSLLLGWGEQTFSRYYDGDMPTKQYSDALKRIYASPSDYLSLLESGKDNLKSKTTYDKSKSMAERLLGIGRGEQHKPKIDVAADYLLSQCQDVTNLALQKALYYTQGFYSAFYGAYIFAEDCEAWVHGPVYRETYAKYGSYCFDIIGAPNEFDCSALSGEEKALLDSVIRHVCCYSGKTLESFTHAEEPWISARAGLPYNAPSSRVIAKKSICRYFTSVKEKYGMLAPANISDYAQYMFSRA
jgi:uncharacterized phage-associated protein